MKNIIILILLALLVLCLTRPGSVKTEWSETDKADPLCSSQYKGLQVLNVSVFKKFIVKSCS